MNDTTTTEGARRLTGCPWPTGIHRYVLGTCSRCGQEDPNPPSNPGGFTSADDEPIPYVPTEAADTAEAMHVKYGQEVDALLRSLDVRDALEAVREYAHQALVALNDEHEGAMREAVGHMAERARQVVIVVRSW